MGIEKRVIDGKEVEVNVTIVDGKEVITPVKKDDKPKGEVSQEVIDRLFKLGKENEEKYQDAERRNIELVERIKKLEEAKVTTTTATADTTTKVYGEQPNGTWVFPQSEEEWDDLIAERPSFGMDLKAIYNENRTKGQKEIKQAHLNSALKVANEILPEMYKKDSEGKLQLDKNGHPIPDDKSDVFKIYCQVANEEGVDGNGRPIILEAKNGPELVALKVKQVLGTEREVELKKKAQREQEESDAKRQKQIKDGQTAPPGQEPPKPNTKVEVKFNSDYERQRAEQKVAQGVYKSLEEFCAIRDNKVVPYGRGNV